MSQGLVCLKKSALLFILWLVIFFSELCKLFCSIVVNIPHIWDCQMSAWFLFLHLFNLHFLSGSFSDILFILYLRFHDAVFGCEFLIHLNIGWDFSVTKMVFFYSAVNIFLLLFWPFPSLCSVFLVYLLVRPKYLDGIHCSFRGFPHRWALPVVIAPASVS